MAEMWESNLFLMAPVYFSKYYACCLFCRSASLIILHPRDAMAVLQKWKASLEISGTWPVESMPLSQNSHKRTDQVNLKRLMLEGTGCKCCRQKTVSPRKAGVKAFSAEGTAKIFKQKLCCKVEKNMLGSGAVVEISDVRRQAY